MKIKKATLKDKEIILNFVSKLIDFEMIFDDQIKKGNVEKLWRRYKKAVEDGVVLIAFEENEPIGVFISFIASKEWRKSLAYVDTIWVEEKYRGKGIGKKLFKEGVKHLKSKGINSIELDVYKENIGAVNFYKSLGFEIMQYKMRKII